jgi:DNA/RNA-binding domain of Phe-tRNA-synthetase-like protein
MQFVVHSEVFDHFPGMRLAVAVAEGIDNKEAPPEIEARWQAAWERAAKEGEYGNAQSHPRCVPWRERFREMGVSTKEYPPAHQAILRRALKGGEPFRINPLVDFYNAVSLEHIVPVGGLDLDQIERPLELRLTREGDHFTSLDADSPVDVLPGEVAYTDGQTVLTRHFVWRQARRGLIGHGTRRVFLVSEVLSEIGSGVVERVVSELSGGLESYFRAKPLAAIVDAEHPTFEW